MSISKPHSLNFFLSLFALAGLVLLLVIGANMFHEINTVESNFAKSHHEYGVMELNRAVTSEISHATDITKKLAAWDETNQQLTDPAYYRYWRQHRIQSINFVPDYVSFVELYDKDGHILLKPDNTVMPETVPQEPLSLIYIQRRPWLIVFEPVMLYRNSTEIFGYVGVGFDFLPTLIKLHLFTHIDSDSLTFSAFNNPIATKANIVDHITFQEQHASEHDQLKLITYKTFSYIAGLVLVILIILYWMVITLFAKPLIKLNSYIESNKQIPIDQPHFSHLVNFPLTEFNNFLQSLQQYQKNLYASQRKLERLNSDLERRVMERTSELQSKNKELESFSYSVSHDLRAPLRSIDGFSQILLEDYIDKLDDAGKLYLKRVISNTHHMADLIDDLLNLARISQIEIVKSRVNISEIANERILQLKERNPEAQTETMVTPGLYVFGDQHLITIALHNLIENAWKYSSKALHPLIQIGETTIENEKMIFVKDNGVGFDMIYATKIFQEFTRLHRQEYEGTGIGLATVSRIVSRHGGKIWAEAQPNNGACFYFTFNQHPQTKAKTSPNSSFSIAGNASSDSKPAAKSC